jgi:hypothetical protein
MGASWASAVALSPKKVTPADNAAAAISIPTIRLRFMPLKVFPPYSKEGFHYLSCLKSKAGQQEPQGTPKRRTSSKEDD